MPLRAANSPSDASNNRTDHLPLPSSESIIGVFRGHTDVRRPAWEVPLDAAVRLALHHGEQWAAETISRDLSADDHVVAAAKRSIDALNSVRVNLITEIDSWVERVVRVSGEASLHTETIGSVIDRLAIAWVRCRRLSDLSQHEEVAIHPSLALRQFAELAGAYDVLVRDIHEGRRRVPRWRALKSYRERR